MRFKGGGNLLSATDVVLFGKLGKNVVLKFCDDYFMNVFSEK